MITETREIYKCGHCRKMYQMKHACVKHEERCFQNPANKRPCFDCDHLSQRFTPFGQGKGFYCKALKHFLIPPIARQRNDKFIFDTGLEENLDMPLKCGQLYVDIVFNMLNQKRVTQEEYQNFEQLALKDAELGEQLYLGFKERMFKPIIS